MEYSEHLELFYRQNLDNYPILETELTLEDEQIWNYRLSSDLSCIGNLVLETRDADIMDKLVERRD